MESLDTSTTYSPTEASIHVVRYEFALGCRPVGRVLDVACGYGYGTHRLAAHEGVDTVVGIDRDPRALQHARSVEIGRGRTSFQAIDLNAPDDLERLGQFDTIVSIETLEHIKDPEGLLRRLKSLWTGRGPIVISLPNDPLYYGRGPSLNVHHLSSGSWLGGRTWSERVLGQGSWYFGSVAAGFSVHSLDGAAMKGGDFAPIVTQTLRPIQGRIVPNRIETQLLPNNALFYMGVWHGTERAEPVDAAVLFPADARCRLPDFLAAPRSVQLGFRPKLLLVADVENWAYDNIAKNIRAFLGDRFTVEIVYQDSFEGDWQKSIHHYLFEQRASFLHFFWRETILKLLTTPWTISGFCKRFDIEPATFAKRISEVVITASVYDHLYLDEEALSEREPRFAMLDGLSVSSKRLQDLYRTAFPDLGPAVIEDGVDLDLFAPRSLERFNDGARPLVVGWVGNSAWNSQSGVDRKGFQTLLKHALEELADEGLPISGSFADRSVEWRKREEMPGYYSEIDVLVCASDHEGTPNPVLEAVACGVPVITTDVGIVRETLGPRQHAFILTERTVDDLKSAIKALCVDRSLLRSLSDENLSRRHMFTWRSKMTKWLNFFKAAEVNHKARRAVKHSLYQAMIQQRFHTDWVEGNLDQARKNNEKLREKIQRLETDLPAAKEIESPETAAAASAPVAVEAPTVAKATVAPAVAAVPMANGTPGTATGRKRLFG